jgi:peptidoglycan/LPS O-acetylase OafA/YrhL
MNYRNEIDGLRAIAVVPVIFFHAGVPYFSGGFVGVDVFFVISGYLITSILLRDIKLGAFSVTDFYERRARRILPALFLVMFVSILFSWFLLLAADMKAFSQSLVSISLLSPNILFWLQTDYFSSAAEMKPLLHTWSLGVEEQFYLFWPLVIFSIWKFQHRHKFLLLIILCLISFFTMQYARTESTSFAFYQFPTRAWELILGALAALFLNSKNGYIFGKLMSNIMATLGLFLIFFSVIWLDKKSGYPSTWTLLPAAGTLLVIIFSQPKQVVTQFLGQAWLVAIGLISYSAYLWHQPVFAFARHYLTVPPPWQLMIFLVFVSFFLAFLTWRFIERPFRSASKVSRPYLLSACFVALSFFMGFGLLGHFSNGYDERHFNSISLREIDTVMKPNYGLSKQCDGFQQLDTCTYGAEPNTVLWGDSYAMHLAPALMGDPESISFVQRTFSSCRPMLGLSIMGGDYSAEWSQNCLEFNQKTVDWILANDQIKRVVISSMFLFSGYKLFDGDRFYAYSFELVENALVDSLRLLEDAKKEVIIVSPMPSNGHDIGRCLARSKIMGERLDVCNFDRDNWSDEFLEGQKFVSRLASRGFRTLWLDDIFCKTGVCITSFGETFVFRDKGHLSVSGATYMREKLNFIDHLLTR